MKYKKIYFFTVFIIFIVSLPMLLFNFNTKAEENYDNEFYRKIIFYENLEQTINLNFETDDDVKYLAFRKTNIPFISDLNNIPNEEFFGDNLIQSQYLYSNNEIQYYFKLQNGNFIKYNDNIYLLITVEKQFFKENYIQLQLSTGSNLKEYERLRLKQQYNNIIKNEVNKFVNEKLEDLIIMINGYYEEPFYNNYLERSRDIVSRVESAKNNYKRINNYLISIFEKLKTIFKNEFSEYNEFINDLKFLNEERRDSGLNRAHTNIQNLYDKYLNSNVFLDNLERKINKVFENVEIEKRKEVIKQLKFFYEIFYNLISNNPNNSDIIIHIDKDFEKEFSVPKKELSKEEYEEILSVISETETIFSIKNEDEKSQEITEKNKKISTLEKEIKNKTDELNLKNTRISSLEQDLETKNLEIHSKAGELSRLNNLISTKDNELNNKSEKIALLENEIISLKANAAASVGTESTDNIENTNTEETTNKENKKKKENEIMFYSAYALVGVVGVVGITIILKIIFTLLRKPRRYRY